MNKMLFLWLDDNEFHAVMAKVNGATVKKVYKESTKFLKAVRRLQINLKMPFIHLWMEDWKNEIDDYDTVIVHASKLTPPVVKYIRRKVPDMRIIVWYWNPVIKSVDVDAFKKYTNEIWSFDEADCKKYNLKYNTQYYFKGIEQPETKNKRDVFFVGGDKGRIEDLVSLKNTLDKNNITNYFHIVPSKNSSVQYKEHYQQDKISYYKVLEHISSSKVIVDIISNNQSGLTLRPLEALFFKKKIITNDKTIINRDFYNSNNIFILGIDDMDKLRKFINSPYHSIDYAIVNRYDFTNWIKRFAD